VDRLLKLKPEHFVFGLFSYCEGPHNFFWGSPATDRVDFAAIWQLGSLVHFFATVSDSDNLATIPAIEGLVEERGVVVDIYCVFQHTKRSKWRRNENGFVLLQNILVDSLMLRTNTQNHDLLCHLLLPFKKTISQTGASIRIPPETIPGNILKSRF